MTRRQRDRFEMTCRIADATAKNDGQPLTTGQLRKAGYTPPGFKSSQPRSTP